jgi:RNA polymerase sigma-70 factor (ECF subfamily)
VRGETPVTPDGEEFARLAGPFRGELLAHCYRMLGSIHDAEDLVQETYLRAWRAYDRFEGRASLRVWLYKIATRACLTALERRGRRPLPSGLGDQSWDPQQPLPSEQPDIPWLQPVPDALLGPPADPEAIVEFRGSVRLALIAALQHLPARQRVVLILREVLAWSSADVAKLLGTSTPAVNSALQRARAQLAHAMPAEEGQAEPTEPESRALLDRYMAAFESADAGAFKQLLREDAQWEMPPFAAWFAGRDAVARFVANQLFGSPGGWRLIPVAANGQPAAAAYLRHADGSYQAHGIQVLTMTVTGIARIVTFLDPRLFDAFGLPAALPLAAPTR